MNKHTIAAQQLRKLYSEEAIFQAAGEILMARIRRSPVKMTDAGMVCEYFRLRLSNIRREEFAVMFLDSQLNILHFEMMFAGTINQTSVYPREIIRRAFELNSSAIILGHNHPSGDLEPSWADKNLTKKIKEVCSGVDIQVVDHIIVSSAGTRSMATMGLM